MEVEYAISLLDQLRYCAAHLAKHGVPGPYTVKMSEQAFEALRAENGGRIPSGFRFRIARGPNCWSAYLSRSQP